MPEPISFTSTLAAIESVIASNLRDQDYCWQMVKLYADRKDAHGVMDMSAEIQSLSVTLQALCTLRESIKKI